nr:GspH/FimT family pseudopilin [Ramlibacter paludis]
MNRRPASRRARGFTLIELLVVIAIVAVGMALAAPGVSSMVSTRKVQNAAQSIVDGLNFARAEAVRRNTAVNFVLRSDFTGWDVTQASDGSSLQGFSSSDWKTMSMSAANSALTATFLATGVLSTTGTQLSQVNIVSLGGNDTTRRVNVFGGGLIRMCDPGVSAANDPRRC